MIMKTNAQIVKMPLPCYRLRRTCRVCFALLAALLLVITSNVRAATRNVTVLDFEFSPASVSIAPGDTVLWTWNGTVLHSVTSGTPGSPDGKFDSGLRKQPGSTFPVTFPTEGMFPYYCMPHGQMGMTGMVHVEAGSAAAAQPLNLSTRLRVQTGEGAMIGGFIITGNSPKKVIIRAIGPSLEALGVAGVLADPIVRLNGSNGPIATNDNWKDSQQAEIQATGVAPTDDNESAIVATLSPGAYTAVVEGKNQAKGVGLVEVYDLEQAANSALANISTRGEVETGANVMIGGFILGKGSSAAKILVRGLGPTLSDQNITGPLANPTLELRNSNGDLVRANDNWKSSQQAQIQATGIPPQNDLEAALVATLMPGSYTAILAGKNGGTGVGLLEAYHLP